MFYACFTLIGRWEGGKNFRVGLQEKKTFLGLKECLNATRDGMITINNSTYYHKSGSYKRGKCKNLLLIKVTAFIMSYRCDNQVLQPYFINLIKNSQRTTNKTDKR